MKPLNFRSRSESTFVAYGVDRLSRVCHAVGLGALVPRATRTFRTLLEPWGDRPIGETPAWRSDIVDDHTPFEISVTLGGRRSEVRVLVEAQGDAPTLRAQQEAGRALSLRMERELGASLGRLRLVEDLFLPADPQGVFSVWHAVSFRGDGELDLKVYLNLQARGRAQAPELAKKALGRLGFDHAWPALASVAAKRGFDADEPIYFSLDLMAHEEARAKVYFRHHRATSQELEAAVSLSPSYGAGEITRMGHALGNGDGPFLARAPVSCFSYVGGDGAQPRSTTLYFPITGYVADDREAKSRISAYFTGLGASADAYERAVDAFAPRPLEAGVGMQSYVSFRREGGVPRLTVYFGPEAYSTQPPRRAPTPVASDDDVRSASPSRERRPRVTDHYDVIVLGSGIAGSISALVLQQVGIKTVVVERKSHPRFVIGESTIPTTAFLMRHLASTYDIPELAQVVHYLGLRDNKCAAWPKQHFWYGVHEAGKPLEMRHETQFETLTLPLGPDVHMLRADADAFLASRLAAYGAVHLENTEVLDFTTRPSGVTVRIRGPEGERELHAKFLVDASGHASFLAKRFGLRDEEAGLRTNTRSIFGHFEGIPELDDALGGFNPDFRFKRSAGTMHHCFPGGWIWVIPFDNGVTSVGVQLDRQMYPLDESITPEQEIAAILGRYPSVKAHLGAMKPVRAPIRADRIQFTTSGILGHGFILTPHAAAFIEPLFSSGIVLTAAFIARFAPVAREAHQANDWNIERFRFIERHFLAEVQQVDRLVNGTIHSFRHYDVFKQFWRNWIIGTLAQFGTGILTGGATRDNPMLYGSGVRGFPEAVLAMHDLVCEKGTDPVALARQLKELIDPWWERLCMPTLWSQDGFAIDSQRSESVRGGDSDEPRTAWLRKLAKDLAYVDSNLKLSNAEQWLTTFGPAYAAQMDRYRRSREAGTDFHRALDRIVASQNPATFDYAKLIGLTPG